jgi:hypothetical protein
VAVGFYDPITETAAVAHVARYNQPESLNDVLQAMLPDMTDEQRRLAYPRIQAFIVGGDDPDNPHYPDHPYPESKELAIGLLRVLKDTRVQLQGVDLFRNENDPSIPHRGNAFVVDSRGGRFLPGILPRDDAFNVIGPYLPDKFFSAPLLPGFDGRQSSM